MSLDSFWDLGHSKQILRLAQAEQARGHNPTELAAEEMRARAGVEQARIGAGSHLGAADIGARGGLDVAREHSRGQLALDQYAGEFLKNNKGLMGRGGGHPVLATPILGDPLHAESGGDIMSPEEKKKREGAALEESNFDQGISFPGSRLLNRGFSGLMDMGSDTFSENPYSYAP